MDGRWLARQAEVLGGDPEGERRLLLDDGSEVVTAPDGEVGRTCAAKHSPDVILLDMDMSVVNGWDFTDAYRETSGRPVRYSPLNRPRWRAATPKRQSGHGSPTVSATRTPSGRSSPAGPAPRHVVAAGRR